MVSTGVAQWFPFKTPKERKTCRLKNRSRAMVLGGSAALRADSCPPTACEVVPHSNSQIDPYGGSKIGNQHGASPGKWLAKD